MTRPIKPNQTELDLYNQSGNDTGGESTINAVNDATSFLRDSVAFRQTSPDAIGSIQDVRQYGLQPGAIVRLSGDAKSLITPDNVPAFADGGYSFQDRLLYTNFTEARAKYPGLRQGAIVGRDGDFRYLGNELLDSPITRSFFQLPSYPFNLGFRCRGIAQAKDFSMYVANRDTAGRYNRESSFTMRQTFPFGGGMSGQAYLLMPHRRVDDTTETANAGVLRDLPGLIGTNWQNVMIVFEFHLGAPILVSNRWTATMTASFGYYNTIQEAYADTGAGVAFSCLDPEHANHLADLTYTGRYVAGVNGSTAYQEPAIATNRLYYLEALAGSRFNDVNNFTPEDIPVADEPFALPPEA
ncbi:MAG: hypothetical protein K0U41_05065 [Gammaproteobacteria bacterium]|nr:hypothetical protein [Gammaproteobacteria bacterium]